MADVRPSNGNCERLVYRDNEILGQSLFKTHHVENAPVIDHRPILIDLITTDYRDELAIFRLIGLFSFVRRR